MNITIVNGIKDPQTNPCQMQLELACVRLAGEHKIDLFTIADMDIHYCSGCFGCWVKHPGRCMFKDDMDKVLSSIVAADLFLVVSPLDSGFITSEAKRALDRVIPLVLPFIKDYDGECHHVPRYEKNADLGILLLDDGGGIEDEAADIMYESFDRLARNFHAQKVMKASAGEKSLMEVLENEIIGG